MGSAGSDGPTVAFRIVIEHDGDVPTVDEIVEALQGCPNSYYIEVHPAGDPCAEVGHLQGDPCPRCSFNKPAKPKCEQACAHGQPCSCDNQAGGKK